MSRTTDVLGRTTVLGVFATRSEAEAALRELRAEGFADDALGFVARNTDEPGESYADDGAGPDTPAGLGGVADVIPVAGPTLFVGPLGERLANAFGGAATLGLAGALLGWGVAPDEALFHEDEVAAGRVLVLVEPGGRAAEAWDVLNRHGGYDRARPPVTTTRHVRRGRVVTGGFDTARRPVAIPFETAELVIGGHPHRRRRGTGK